MIILTSDDRAGVERWMTTEGGQYRSTSPPLRHSSTLVAAVAALESLPPATDVSSLIGSEPAFKTTFGPIVDV